MRKRNLIYFLLLQLAIAATIYMIMGRFYAGGDSVTEDVGLNEIYYTISSKNDKYIIKLYLENKKIEKYILLLIDAEKTQDKPNDLPIGCVMSLVEAMRGDGILEPKSCDYSRNMWATFHIVDGDNDKVVAASSYSNGLFSLHTE